MIFTLNIDASLTSIVSASVDVKRLKVLKGISEPELSDIYYYVRKTFFCLSMHFSAKWYRHIQMPFQKRDKGNTSLQSLITCKLQGKVWCTNLKMLNKKKFAPDTI